MGYPRQNPPSRRPPQETLQEETISPPTSGSLSKRMLPQGFSMKEISTIARSQRTFFNPNITSGYITIRSSTQSKTTQSTLIQYQLGIQGRPLFSPLEMPNNQWTLNWKINNLTRSTTTMTMTINWLNKQPN